MNESQMAEELFDLIEKRKEIERKETALKAHFKNLLGESKSLMVGGYFISLSERLRTDLDKEKLRTELGSRLSEFEKISSYNVLDLKKVA